jgi:hypothetical protein
VESSGGLPPNVAIQVIVNRYAHPRIAIDRFAPIVDSVRVTGQPPDVGQRMSRGAPSRSVSHP